MSRLVVPSAVVAALLAFAPWGTLSIQILGEWSPGQTFSGADVGSGFGSLAAAWVVIALAAAAVIAARGNVAALRIAAVLLLVFTIYSAATLAHHSLGVTANGQDVSNLLGVRVSIAWGSIAEILVAGLLVAGALLRPRDQELEQ